MPENNNKKLVRVISYIDGYNLYFGLREKARIKDEKGNVRITEWQKYLWLNVVELSSSLLLPNQTLTGLRPGPTSMCQRDFHIAKT